MGRLILEWDGVILEIFRLWEGRWGEKSDFVGTCNIENELDDVWGERSTSV